MVARQEILALGKITQADTACIRQCRTKGTQLGFSYQLAFVKIRNYFPQQNPFEIENDILHYVGYQLGLPVELIKPYQEHRILIHKHQYKIKQYLGLHEYDAVAKEKLAAYILEQTYQTDQISLLVPKAQCFLKEQGILQPALSTLRRIVGTYRDLASNDIELRLTKELSEQSKENLKALLIVNEKRSLLWKLKRPPGVPSVNGIKILTTQLQRLEELEINHLDLSWVNNNYKQRLAKRACYCSVTRINKIPENKRYAILICLCRQLHEETIDYIVEMLIKLFDKAEKSANKQIDLASRKKRKDIKQILQHFKTVGTLILNTEITDDKLRKTIYKAISKKSLREQVANTTDWLDCKYSHVFHLLKDRYSYFRKFFPIFIRNIQLCNDGTFSSTQLLAAIELLKKLNDDNDNKCPGNAPIDFIPPKLKQFIINSDGTINRHGWETALLQAVRDEIKHGNLSVNKGRFFCQFDQFFMPDKLWEKERERFFKKAGLPCDAKDIKQYLINRLHNAVDEFVRVEKTNTYAKIENNKWELSIDEAQQFNENEADMLIRLRDFLKTHMRKIKLPDLLVEVDNDLHITNYFMSYDQSQRRDKDAIVDVIATWMAWGCGIGLSTMPSLVHGISYDRLRTISDFYLSDEDSSRYALRDVVNAISELDITGHWGTGKTSASDSIRMEYHSKVLHRGYSTCFGDYAIEFYTFVADTYAPFYSKPIECTNRDSGHVLDGVLYNETGLQLLDHYVDTHGYTEINLTGFAMFGKRLNPRIKNVKSQRIYKIDPSYNFSTLTPLLNGKEHQIDMDCIVEQYDRMGQFYASMELGYSMASTAMRRLVSFTDKNNFYKANREFGRVIKTENILQHMVDSTLRERRRRGLLKTEQLHQLSREVSYGKHGKITARELSQLKNSCNCLTLIDACIVYWQAKEMMRVCEKYNLIEQGLDLDLLKHISPIEWSNLILYGEYFIQKSLIK